MASTNPSNQNTIDILVCTLNEGIENVPHVLMKEQEDVEYIVSMQYTDKKYLNKIPEVLKTRKDVKVFPLKGRGLSRNRNYALSKSSADICIIADDDAIYKTSYIDIIRQTYTKNKDTDIALFRTMSSEGILHKKYPDAHMSYAEAEKQYYYPSSVEITMRRKKVQDSGTVFNEHYGLGAAYLCSGEESVFLKDAGKNGLRIECFPYVIAETPQNTTGEHFLTDIRVQRSKGATFCYCYGTAKAAYLCIKEAAFYLVHKGINPLPLVKNMFDGIKYCRNIVWKDKTATLQ